MASSKDAHKALTALLKELKKIDISGLQRKATRRPDARSTSPEEWQDTLQRAAAEIPEWCVSFSIDGPPKPSRSRSNRSRR